MALPRSIERLCYGAAYTDGDIAAMVDGAFYSFPFAWRSDALG